MDADTFLLFKWLQGEVDEMFEREEAMHNNAKLSRVARAKVESATGNRNLPLASEGLLEMLTIVENFKSKGQQVAYEEFFESFRMQCYDLFNAWDTVESPPLPGGGAPKSTPKSTLTPEAQILEDARATVNGDRQDSYGNAEDSFDAIASFWSTYLTGIARRAVSGFDPNDSQHVIVVKIENHDVASLQALFKIAREMHSPKRDNRLDGIGYLALAERCHVKNEEKKNPEPF